MLAADIPLGMRLKAQAGWNQTEVDWQRFLAMESGRCLVAEADGNAVGTAAVFVFEQVAWIAMVLVDPQVRGQGVGTALMHDGLEWLDRQRIPTIRLDATHMGRPIYERLGFVSQFELARFEGVPRLSPLPFHRGLRALRPEDRDSVFALDAHVTATPRRPMLEQLMAVPGGSGTVMRREGSLAGYLLRRPGSKAEQIGPAIADPDAGLVLLAHAMASASGPVYVDIPLANHDALALARDAGLTEQRRFVRMCRGTDVREDLPRLLCSSGPEKG
jgi:GNAT superfamily N-acetyltransferase